MIKIVPDANMRQYAADDLPDHVSATSDEMVTQVMEVKNVNAAQLVPVLRPLMPQNAQLSAVPGSNILIISDHASNVNRMMRIIARIDQSGRPDIDVMPLQSAAAAEIVRVLNTLLAQAAEGASGVKMVADDRSNSVLIGGEQSQRLRIRALDRAPGHPARDRRRHARALPALRRCGGSRRPAQGADHRQRRQQQQLHHEQTARAHPEPAATECTGQYAGAGRACNCQRRQHRRRGHAVAGRRKGDDVGGPGQQRAGDHGRPRSMRAVKRSSTSSTSAAPQVLVEAIIAEVAVDKDAELGINWAVDPTQTAAAVGGFVSPIGGTRHRDLTTAITNPEHLASNLLPGTTLGIGRIAGHRDQFRRHAARAADRHTTNIIATPTVVTWTTRRRR